MDEDLIVTQIGLIFSQTRYIRMALESLERSAARYTGVALDVAAAGPHQWGAPPLEGGALRVFIVNIGDLIPEQGGFLGFVSSIFRLFSSMVGGIVGGVISGIALPVILAELADVTKNVLVILDRLGFNKKDQSDKGKSSQESSTTVADFLTRAEHTADTVATVLGLANAQQKSRSTGPASAESQAWLQNLQVISRIVDGLILLVPNLIGAFASLLKRLDELKIGILDLLEFTIRNILILRGVILLTIYDTIGSTARLAAQIVSLISTAASSLLGTFFRMLEGILTAVLDTLGFLSSALTDMVNSLLPWLVDTVFTILNALSETSIFQIVIKLAGVTPTVSIPSFTPMPNFANDPAVQAALANASTSVMGIASKIQTDVTSMLGTTAGLMTNIAGKMKDAIGPNGEGLTRNIRDLAKPVIQNAEDVTKALRTTRDTAEKTRGTELDTIANAYETWLTSGGLNTILQGITDYFKKAPVVEGSMMNQVANAATPAEPPRPTVEIAEVTIQITAAAPERASQMHEGTLHTSSSTFDPDLELDSDELYARGDWKPVFA